VERDGGVQPVVMWGAMYKLHLRGAFACGTGALQRVLRVLQMDWKIPDSSGLMEPDHNSRAFVRISECKGHVEASCAASMAQRTNDVVREVVRGEGVGIQTDS